MDSQRQERPFHHVLIFLTGALAMLGALLAVARVSGGERSDRHSPAELAQRRELAYGASAQSYCAQLISDDVSRRERCMHDQISSARKIYRLTLPMRDDDPRRRILDACGRAFGEDMELRLACYEEQLGSLQPVVGWVGRPSRRP